MNFFGNLVGGEWTKGGETIGNTNPSDTNDVIGEYALGSDADVAAAIQAARDAFPAWSCGSIQERCEGICTSSLAHAAHFRRHAEAGMVMVNLPTAGVDYHVAFGGRKASSYGPREQGSYAAEFFTSVKTSYVNAGAV